MSTIVSADPTSEQDVVRRWRLGQLVQAGYAPSDALVLSRRDDVDLHLALRLLAAGCPAETAVRILL